MSDEITSAKTEIAKLRHDVDAPIRLPTQSFGSVIEQMGCVLGLNGRQKLKIGRALERTTTANWAQEIASATGHWQELIKQTATTNGLVESVAGAHQSWLKPFKLMGHDHSHLSRLHEFAKLDLRKTALQLNESERLLAGIDFKVIGSRFQVEKLVIARLENSIRSLFASYNSLADSLSTISDITRLPTFVLPGATREIYTTSFAFDSICHSLEYDEDEAEINVRLVEEGEHETSGCISLLEKVDPKLAKLHRGARDAQRGRSTDWERHILISLRELWSHLLRQLAPDEHVLRWISDKPDRNRFLHDGKLTRKARVLYVCRELNCDPLTEFVEQDTRALMELFNLFNRVHELEPKLTDIQLRAILLKSDSSLEYVISIWLENSGS